MSSYSKELKDQACQEVSLVKNVVLVSKKHGIPLSTAHSWLRKRDEKISYKKKIIETDFSQENKTLKKQLSEKEAENMIIRELLKKLTKSRRKIRSCRKIYKPRGKSFFCA